jgi:hypothetical protein
MIKDPEARQRIRDSWKTVRKLQARIHTALQPTLFSLVPSMTNFREVPDSLLLLFAVSVLENALDELRNQGVFSSRGSELGRLIEASRGTLRWQDYGKIQEIKNRRNDLAHERVFPPSDKCGEYLDAIAKELLAWGVLEPDFNKGKYEVSFRPTSE